MVFERRRKSASEHGEFWRNHGRTDGETVQCGACGRSLRVKVHTAAKVTVATPDALAGIALICGDCGRLFCTGCAQRDHPYLLTCDRCRRPGTVTIMTD